MSVNYNSKPPLGLRPREIVDRNRGVEILEACLRYMDVCKAIPDDWIHELKDINNRLQRKSDREILETDFR